MALTVDLAKVLDKKYEDGKLADAPVAALSGVSEADAEALKTAFGIKTVRDPRPQQVLPRRGRPARPRQRFLTAPEAGPPPHPGGGPSAFHRTDGHRIG